MKKQAVLTRFIKNGCSNFNGHYQTCLDGRRCLVLNGERCGYFEKFVLGPPDYKYRLPGYDYQRLFAQYAECTGAQKQKVKVKRCGDCGTIIEWHQKFCKRCKKNHRLKTRREYQRKFRLQQKISA
jgi:hypothetical protein